jgi:hypothetical protein
MKPGRENAAGIHIGAGLSGYVASLCQATLCAEYGLPNEIHDSHASYIHHWLKLCSPRHNLANHEVTIM